LVKWNAGNNTMGVSPTFGVPAATGDIDAVPPFNGMIANVTVATAALTGLHHRLIA
jgi:hypothetical protein